MGEAEGAPTFQWNSRKIWVTVSIVELAIILILAGGLAHFARRPGERDKLDIWPLDGSMLASLDKEKWTLPVATDYWKSCLNRTKFLEANISTLNTEVVRLNTRFRQKELESKAVEGELLVLKNWTKKLEELNIQQREIIQRFHQQQKLWSDSGHLRHGGVALLMVSAIAMTFLV